MKTARDVLLDRCDDAASDLDRIRRGVMADLPARPARRPAWSPLTWAAVLWEQLVVPSRYAWAGIAAVWAVLLFVNARDVVPPPAVAVRAPTTLSALLKTARARQEQQNELLGVCSTVRPAPRPAPRDQSRAPGRPGAADVGARNETCELQFLA